MTYTTTLSHDPVRLDALRSEWDALLTRSASQTIYLTWDWLTTWWEHCRGDAELWLIETRAEDGRLVGLAPLMLADHSPFRGVHWRQVQFIGASAAFDHLDFIIEQGCEAAIIPTIFETLRAEANRWDVLYLSSVADSSPTLPLLTGDGMTWHTEEPMCCPAIALPASWDDFHEALSKRKRKNLRRAHRKLDEECPDGWHVTRITDPDAVGPVMTEMIQLHQAKWAALGMPGGFPDAETIAFQQAIARRLAETDRLWLFQLWIGDTVAAIEYAYAYAGRVYAYASGVNFDLKDYSPGQMLMEHMIRTAIESGMHTYDFLRGDEEYKFFWQAECHYDRNQRWLYSPASRREQQWIDTARAAWRRGKTLLPTGLRQRMRRAADGDSADS